MFAIKSELLLFFMIIHVSDCQRRIKDGELVVVDKKYVVYFVKAPVSKITYDFWLCGGAIVSSEFVITSAACVNDVDYLYVIAGYNKYVTDTDIELDQCTSKKKKKVVYTCSPKGYELKYGELDYWSYIDIALVRVESPFDFTDQTYETLCSYKPTTIAINYEEKYQEPGMDAMVLGWGHTEGWRKPGDTNNYNQEFLRYAPTLLLNKTTCMEHYENYINMSEVIKSYMICSLGKGNINDGGDTILKSLPIENGCTTQQQKVLGFEGVSCEQKSSDESFDDDTRRYAESISRMYNESFNKTVDINFIQNARRSGICQNDHGGPLVTWSGAREILIGIASVFKVSDESECMGPYLYTSTLCTGLFLDCVLTTDQLPSSQKAGRRDLCDRPASERGYETIERYISWRNHPAGPAENENIGRSGNNNKNVASHFTNKNQPQSASYAADKMTAENAKYQDATKYESNNMYLTQINPVLHESYAANERYPGIERYPGHDMYPANERYPEYNSYPGHDRHPANEKNLANKMNPGHDMHPTSAKNPTNGMFSGHDRHPANEKNPVNEMYPGHDRHLVNAKNPTNQMYPGHDMHFVNVNNPIHEMYPGHDRYPANLNNPINEMYPGHDRHPANVNNPINEMYPGHDRHPANAKNPVNEMYPGHDRHPINAKNPVNEMYPGHDRSRGNGRYPVPVGSPNVGQSNKAFAVRPQRPLRN